jgi:aminoglycoside phosphotransferase family enzyme
MTFLQPIRNGDIAAWGKPKKEIETLLSNVFFFDTTVVKVYKHQTTFFGDMADPEFRTSFYTEDFFWNHSFAPEVYVHLGGFAMSEQGVACVPFEEGSEYFIEMKQIDHTKNLTTLLSEGNISAEECSQIVRHMIETAREVAKQKKEQLEDLFATPWLDLHIDNLESLRSWGYLADAHIPRREIDQKVDFLIEISKTHPYFTSFDASHLTAAIDNNCDNLLYQNGQPSFIDVMTPKHSWKVHDEFFGVTRTAVDAYVLGTPALADAIYDTYRTYRDIPEDQVRLIYELRSAIIQWAYRHILKEPKRAAKYKAYIDTTLETLKQSVSEQ